MSSCGHWPLSVSTKPLSKLKLTYLLIFNAHSAEQRGSLDVFTLDANYGVVHASRVKRGVICEQRLAITDLFNDLPQTLVDKLQGQSKTHDQNMMVVSANFPNRPSSRPFLQLGEF